MGMGGGLGGCRDRIVGVVAPVVPSPARPSPERPSPPPPPPTMTTTQLQQQQQDSQSQTTMPSQRATSGSVAHSMSVNAAEIFGGGGVQKEQQQQQQRQQSMIQSEQTSQQRGTMAQGDQDATFTGTSRMARRGRAGSGGSVGSDAHSMTNAADVFDNVGRVASCGGETRTGGGMAMPRDSRMGLKSGHTFVGRG